MPRRPRQRPRRSEKVEVIFGAAWACLVLPLFPVWFSVVGSDAATPPSQRRRGNFQELERSPDGVAEGVPSHFQKPFRLPKVVDFSG